MKQLILAFLIAVAGCSDLVPATVLALQTVNPLTADPADIALKLTLPDSVAVQPGSAVLTLSAARREGEGTEQAFALLMQDGVLSVDPKDHAALRALQAQVASWEAADPDGTTGSLGLGFEPCRTGDVVPPDARGSVAIRLEARGVFLPLIDDGLIHKLFRNAAPDGIEPCL